ncbi:MAG: hypothetical protein ACLPYS_20445 [Vulcanimicrobiaceae bacterium]
MATAHVSITLHLNASPERALPMFDPINESRWSPDWHPSLLGDGRVAPGLVFTTADEAGRAVWLLDRYDPQAGEIRYVTVRPTTLTTIDIAVASAGKNESIATVEYTRTALESCGDENVASFARDFPAEGLHWQVAINAALALQSER